MAALSDLVSNWNARTLPYIGAAGLSLVSIF
jgi:hypothetical protein